MNVTKWADAVRTVLAKAKISDQALADEAGVARMTVHRYVRGTRKPTPANVRSFNRSVAKLMQMPEVADYLFALALLDGLLKPAKGDLGLDGLRALLLSLDSYFVDGARSAITAAFEVAATDDAQRVAILIAIAAMRGKNLLGSLDGHPKRELAIDEVLWAFEHAGVPLGAFVRRDRETKIRRIRDFSALRLEMELARLSKLSGAERADTLHAVMRVFDDASTAIQQAMQDGSIVRAINGPRLPQRRSISQRKGRKS